MLPDDPNLDRLASLSSRLNRPLTIGSNASAKRLVLAPMTFLGHVAFRQLLSRFGGHGLLFSEMCSSKTVPTENPNVSNYFRWRNEELPQLACQIVGRDPERMASAAQRIEAEGFFGVDVNFGCSTGSICRQSCGAALLREPELAGKIVARIRRAVRIPLTVKFRTGWQDDPAGAVQMGRRFEDSGADAVTFHPRVAPDRRARAPKWEYIGRLKQALRIPVIGNGNVFDAETCLRMLEQTGCDAVAIGRIAIARPWTFAEWTEGFEPGPDTYETTAALLLDLTARHFEEKAAVRRMRKFMQYFAANFRYGHTLSTKVQNATGIDEIRAVLKAFFAAPPELSTSPNMNYLQ
jgi:nifR3 family TIM-barrel protein